MSPYNESVSLVETPFNDYAPGHWELDEYGHGLNQAFHQRMFLILAVVAMIIVGFALFVMPHNGVASTSAAAISQPVLEAARAGQVETGQNELPPQQAISATISPIFTPEVRYWEDKIVAWASSHNLDPNIVATIMQIESCGNPEAVSVAGARGLFQVMPFHFSSGENMLDPDTNATRGLNFYNEQLRYTGNDKLLSFAGYNGGYAASGGAYANWPDETKRYYNWAKGIFEDAASGAASSETLEAWLAAGGAAGCAIAASNLNIN